MNLIENIHKVNLFGKTLVLKFYYNLTKQMADPTSSQFQKIFIRGKFLVFSPSLISAHYEGMDFEGTQPLSNICTIVSTLTGGKLRDG